MKIENIIKNISEEEFNKFKSNINDLKEELDNLEDYISVNVKEVSDDLKNEVDHLKLLIEKEKQRFEFFLKKNVHLNIENLIKQLTA